MKITFEIDDAVIEKLAGQFMQASAGVVAEVAANTTRQVLQAQGDAVRNLWAVYFPWMKPQKAEPGAAP